MKVLVADDNHANRALVTRILTRRGHDVLTAVDGAQALAILENEAVDVALLDVQMPEQDGLSLTGQVRQREQLTGGHLPIVAITAHALKGDRERCLAAGMDAYLPKPIDARQLCTLVESLGGRRERRMRNEPAMPQEAPPIDFGPALQRLEGDRELLQEQMRFLLREVPGLIGETRAAIVDGDGHRLRVAAHRLQGLATGFDARDAVFTARALEQMGQDADFREAAAKTELLERQLDALCVAIRAYLNEPTG